MREVAERDLRNVINWFNANLLTVNVNKTKIVPFTSYKKYLPTYKSISVENCDVTLANSVKYLGIFIDSFLKWDEHVKLIKNKLRGIIYKFYLCRNILSLNQLKTLYYALVESILQYGIIGWGGLKKTLMDSIETIQKIILKILYFKSTRYPSDKLYDDLKVFDIRQLFSKTVLTFLFNNKHYLNELNHVRDTRASTVAHLILPRAQKTIGQRSFIYIGPRLYNNMPEFLKHLYSKRLFKNKLKYWILSNDRYFFHSIVDPQIN